MFNDAGQRFPYWRRVLTVAADARVACWPMMEPSGSVALDLSGNGRHGAYTGATLGYPGIGDGLAAPFFDGVNDVVNIYTASLATAFNANEGTIAIWVRATDLTMWTDATARRIVLLQADGSNFVRILKSATSGTIPMVYNAGGTSKTVTLSNPNTLDWLHIALTWSKSADEVRGYMNGTQRSTTQTALGTWAGSLASTTTLLCASSTSGGSSWFGIAAHAALWTRALSAGEVAELYRVT